MATLDAIHMVVAVMMTDTMAFHGLCFLAFVKVSQLVDHKQKYVACLF